MYGDRLFRSASIVLTLTSVAFFGLLFLLALFFQDGLHFTALQAGSTICPEAFGVIIASQFISRRLYPAVGPRRIMAAGLVLIAGIAALLSMADTGTSVWLLRAILFVMGFGVAAVFLPSQAAGFATVGAARTSSASTIFNAQRQVGGAVGVALLTAVITALHPVRTVAGRATANLPAFHHGLLVWAGVDFGGAAAALRVRVADAAPTMIRPGRRILRGCRRRGAFRRRRHGRHRGSITREATNSVRIILTEQQHESDMSIREIPCLPRANGTLMARHWAARAAVTCPGGPPPTPVLQPLFPVRTRGQRIREGGDNCSRPLSPAAWRVFAGHAMLRDTGDTGDTAKTFQWIAWR